MEEPKAHKIQVRNREGTEGNLTVGDNTVVLLDGKPLGGAYSFKFEVNAKSVSKVTIELYAEVEIDANVDLGEPRVQATDLVMNGKPIAIHTLSNYAPTGIAVKPFTDADGDKFMEDNKELMDDLATERQDCGCRIYGGSSSLRVTCFHGNTIEPETSLDILEKAED